MSRAWVCLVYHEVLRTEPEPGAGNFFAVSRATFGRQLDAIRSAGFRGCSVAEALASPDAPRVAISFDDGTIGHFDHAFPELVERGMTATFYVTTSWVGRPGYATWDQLRAMQEAGMEIGSHTQTHPFLSELPHDALWAELANSRGEIDRALDQETAALAFPGGDAPRRVERGLLEKAGYSVVATSRWGLNHDGLGKPRFIRRCTVHARTTDAVFQRIVSADPWLRAQRMTREWILGTTRRLMGPSNYARFRRRVLDRGGHSPGM